VSGACISDSGVGVPLARVYWAVRWSRQSRHNRVWRSYRESPRVRTRAIV